MLKNSVFHMYSVPRNRIGEQLSQFEREHILTFAKEVDLEPKTLPTRFHQFSFIQMNSIFIELIDGYYPNIGRSIGIGAFLLSILMFIALAMNLGLYFIFPDTAGNHLVFNYFLKFISFSVLILIIYMCYKNIKAFKYYELSGYYYLPIRFNRKTKKIYFYLSNGEQVERSIGQIIFTISANKGFMDGKYYCISAFELNSNGNITSHYSIGQSSYHLSDVMQLWEFINVYWIYGPEPLMPANIKDNKALYDRKSHLVYCNDVINIEPKASDSWERIRLLHDRNPFFEILSLPFDILHFLGRRICLKYRKMPEWTNQIEDQNKVDAHDLYKVSAKDNYKINYFSVTKEDD
ncbi:DUF6708 domain-containing protein [Acinetobacter gerneri]|uniref:DUF6708 domain-containing protein n=1 Tax=Acinetobacter gerneri TaxID=202952 RepID=UPI0032148BD2